MPTQPTLDDPAVHQKIIEQIYRLDRNLKAMGLGPMDPLQLRATYGKIKQAVGQMMAQRGQGMPAASAPRPLMQAIPPGPEPKVPMSMLAEGGFINDQSGQATQRMRKQLGLQLQSFALPPEGGSRVYGSPGNPTLGLSGSAISNVPAMPGDQTIQYPIIRTSLADRTRHRNALRRGPI